MAASADAGAAVEWKRLPPYGTDGKDFRAKYQAQCYCKRVSFQVSAEPMTAKLCDCSVCQRLHGAPVQWAALFQKDQVCFDPEGFDLLRWYDPKNDVKCRNGEERVLPSKLRCSHCGTWLADEGRNNFMTFPTLFSFDATAGPERFPVSFRPKCRIWCSSRSLELQDHLPSYLDDGKTPKTLQDFLLDIAPPLDGRSYKGQSGRIGLLGGSVDFAGAPYYAGMAALRVGAELLYLCTAEEATGPIKSYSPELMVSEVYRWAKISAEDPGVVLEEQNRMVGKMEALLPRFHALVIGCGLGRDMRVLNATARVIEMAKERRLPLVLDADALWLVERQPEVVAGYEQAVLTPNAAEFRRLCQAFGSEDMSLPQLCEKLKGPMVLQKGAVDRICRPGQVEPLSCSEPGAPRRPGGLGDFLAGSLAVLLGWAVARRRDPIFACQAASMLVRRACKVAYDQKKRSMVAPDVLDEVGSTFEELCPSR